MAKLSFKAGTTSKLIDVFLQDSSSSIAAGLTGLVFNTSGLTAYYKREGQSSWTAITLATMTQGTWATGGFKEGDATHAPGMYEMGLPDAAIAAGAKSVKVFIQGATNLKQTPVEIELTANDNQDAVRGGMTALPNAAAEAAGGLFTRGTGAGQINQAANGNIDANTVKITGTAQTAGDLAALLTTISGKTTNLPSDPADASDIAAAFAAIFTTVLTESYAVDNAAPTAAQALFMLLSRVGQYSISGTTITGKKIDGTTTAEVFTMDDGTNPTSRVRTA